MRNPKLYVMFEKPDGITITIKLFKVEGYTLDSVLGYAGYYKLPSGDKEKFKLDEEYVFWTDNYKVMDIDGKKCIGQKLGSVGAVPIMPCNSSAPGENYSVLLRTHGITKGYKTLVGEKKLPLSLIVIIVVVLILCVGVIYFGRSCITGEEVDEGAIPAVEESVPQKAE